MARTKRDVNLENRTQRFKLEVGAKYQCTLESGRFLAYRRPKCDISGTWMARWHNPATNTGVQARLGAADDYSEADGEKVLTYTQAVARAQEWCKERAEEAQLALDGVVRKRGPFTVADAMAAYFEDAERRGVKGVELDRQRANAWILPDLGALEVASLTRARIEAWLRSVAEAPKRKRTAKPGAEPALKTKTVKPAAPVASARPLTEDEKRARKDSANRVLTTLRASLNHALDRGWVKHDDHWKAVKPYRGTTSARIRFLDANEQVRLVKACPPDFRRLVRGALYTGARYGELGRLLVKDFNATAGTVFIEFSKNGKARHVVLTQEGKDFFTHLTAGRSADDLMLVRDGVERRKLHTVGVGWGKSEQARFMKKVCEAAKIALASFHELRHTYASGLVNAGLPMAYVSAQLGHADTRVTEKHYGHLAPAALVDSIRRLAPQLGLGDDSKVVPLKIAAKG